MRKRIYIFVNGILTVPGSASNWNRRAVTWTHLHTEHRAESLEYLSTVLMRPFFQRRRARKLANKIRFYAAARWEIVLAGHSNGCDVIVDALRMIDSHPRHTPIRGVHLIAAACDRDFEANGLNAAIRNERITHNVRVYVGGKDIALRLASTIPGWLLGYGTLGLCGPSELDYDASKKVITHVEPTFRHGTWFGEKHFEQTLRLITDQPFESEHD